MDIRKKDIYDYAVIGAGLTGLVIANKLAMAGHRVVLVEGAEFPGGVSRAVENSVGKWDNGLRFLPGNGKAVNALEDLGKIIPIEYQIEENPLQTYEGGELKPFVGFGDFEVPFYDEFAYFTDTHRVSVNVYEWIEKLVALFPGTLLTKSFVTQIGVALDQVTHLVINGQKKIAASKYVLCTHPKELLELLPPEVLTARVRQRLSKNHLATALCLDVFHTDKITDNGGLHLLHGASELGTCVGQFVSVDHPEVKQVSRWISYLDQETMEDTELVASALKKVKRQIKRPYPEALDKMAFERIVVTPLAGGQVELKLTDKGALTHAENLWVASPHLSPERNILGSLMIAKTVSEQMTLGTEVLQQNSCSVEAEHVS